LGNQGTSEESKLYLRTNIHMNDEVHSPTTCALQIDVDVATHIKITDDGPKRRFLISLGSKN
jgi:hypothetical protein